MKLTLCLIAGAVCLHAATVNFNDYPNATGNPSAASFSSGGLNFSRAGNGSCSDCLFIAGNPNGSPFTDYGVIGVSNGTPYLAVTGDEGDSVTVTSPGTTFSLLSIDLNKLVLNDAPLVSMGGPHNATTINAVGTLLGGGTVVATFRLNGGVTFQNFTFPAEWQNLVAVKFSGNSDGTSGATATSNALFTMDNIVFTPGAAFTCSYSLGNGGRAFASFGAGPLSFSVFATPGCLWTVTGVPSWIDPVNVIGLGNGLFSYFLQPNSGAARSATLTVAGLPLLFEQASGLISNLSNAGSFAQITSRGTWKFTLDSINLGTAPGLERFQFMGNDGTSLGMPWTFPQTPGLYPSGPLLANTLDRTLAPNAQLVMESTGADTATALIGWGQMQAASTDKMSGFGIFSNAFFHWEAVVPLETRNAPAYFLAFDNTGALTTGVAVANLNSSGAAINVIIRDDTGAQIGGSAINLVSRGHTSFMLNDPQLGFPVTNNKRGTIEFDRPTGGNISVLGLRANQISAAVSALTTLPVLASVTPNGGGSITHATYNGGFASVFYVVNTGTSSGQFTLSFADETTGNPIQFPLSLPQSGTTTTTSALTRTLAPGAMLVAETQAQDALAPVVGSAQLTTTGGAISAFEVFRWTTFGQEASVPLESRSPTSFVLVFDDTGVLSTGVALANRLSGSAADIPVTIRDDAGTLLLTTSIHLSAQGHASFMLPDRYAAAAGKRGMVEFTVPAGGSISVVGLRAKADGTLTTIPVLTK